MKTGLAVNDFVIYSRGRISRGQHYCLCQEGGDLEIDRSIMVDVIVNCKEIMSDLVNYLLFNLIVNMYQQKKALCIQAPNKSIYGTNSKNESCCRSASSSSSDWMLKGMTDKTS